MMRKVSVLLMIVSLVGSSVFAQQRAHPRDGGQRAQAQGQAQPRSGAAVPRAYAVPRVGQPPMRGYGQPFLPMGPRLGFYPQPYRSLAFGRPYAWVSYLAIAAALGTMIGPTTCVTSYWDTGYFGEPVWVQGYCPPRPGAVVVYPSRWW